MSEQMVTFVDGTFSGSGGTISVLDHGLLYGDGVFDTMAVWDGRVFRLEEHLDRLYASLGAVGIEAPYARAELRGHVLETVRRTGLRRAYVKCVVTRGSNGMPLMNPKGCRPTCVIFAMPYVSKVTDEQRAAGVRLRTGTVRRVPSVSLDARIKSLNYLNLVLAKVEAQAAGADEALLTTVDGLVSEATGANLVLLRGGELVSPVDDVLEGVTRSTVLELARDAGYRTRLDHVRLSQVLDAEEAFLTSTAGGVIAVAEVDGTKIGDGRRGPVSEALERAYVELLASTRYGTPVYTDGPTPEPVS